MLTEGGPFPESRAPWEVGPAERAAIRVLVRHFGWRMVEPGRLVRVPTPRASGAMDAPTTGVRSATAGAMAGGHRIPA